MQTMVDGILLYGRLYEAMAAAGNLVGHGHHAHHVVAAFDEAAQALYGKVGSAEKYYTEVLFSHWQMQSWQVGSTRARRAQARRR